MRFYADLHVHSKYSRATSKNCDLENLAFWGRKKGISVIGTGDFTHPAWFGEIKDKLVPAEPGLFRLRNETDRELVGTLPSSCRSATRFMLSVEISTIYKKGEKTRKIHHLIYAPTIEQAERINGKLASIGNIRSDGRPILGLDSRHLLEIVLEAGEDCYLVPAHIWTPWFAVLGSRSGFDSIGACYRDLAEHIFAVETGLSSDPEMNWRVSDLDRYRLVSNSDAHSPPKLGREACVFDTDLDYFAMRRALETGEGYGGTVEFFPEEGKYHMDGHRKCGVRLSPGESRAHDGLCPVCGKPLTLGVLYRVEQLADRADKSKPEDTDAFVSLVPLPEVIAETEQVGAASKTVAREYESLLTRLGSELGILNDIPLEEIRSSAPSSLIPEAIARMREGCVIREPGYDGEYGRIRLFQEQELRRGGVTGSLFAEEDKSDAAKESVGEDFGDTDEATETLPGVVADTLVAHPVVESVSSFERSNLAGVDLDPDQRRALEIIRGPLLITAGPGSGKTRVLTHRIAHLITECGVAPGQCLAITFTRRAAEEMRERLETLLPGRSEGVPVMTFHSLGLRMLEENRVGAGLPRGFRVSSDAERRALLINRLKLSVRKATMAIREVSRLKRQRLSAPADIDLLEACSLLEREREIHGVLDYDDLMILPLELFEKDPGLTATYRQRYAWVSVDEYQDIDELQYALLRQLVPEDGNLCAIGDPDQAIYAFRGADVEFFLRFEHDFPGAERIQLGRNYRSGRSIVSAATQMIEPATLVEDRQVRALLEDTGKVVIHRAATDKAEAESVVHHIEQLIGGLSFYSIDTGRSDGTPEQDYTFADFAVLYRTEAQADVLEEAFLRSGIPFQRHGHRCLSDLPTVRNLLDSMTAMREVSTVTERLREAQAHIRVSDDKGADDAFDAVMERLRILAERCDNRWQQFLSEIHLASDIDVWDERADRCSLLTLHAAKGLEFRVVFVIGCEDGVLPLKWKGEISEAELAEERRLFYVGMTRARDRLFLMHAARRRWQGRVREYQASPFLRDIEDDLLEMTRRAAARKRAEKSPQLDLL
ncbi:MAG: UvrD-helicase domain-containing protein [Woeseia sp.]